MEMTGSYNFEKDFEEFKNKKWYVVVEIFKDGSKSFYGTGLGNNFVLREEQLRGVKAHCTRNNIKYEIHEVKIQFLDNKL